MEADTLTNFIKNLGRVDFGCVVSLVMKKVFNLSAIDVDGAGNGGSDWRVFKDKGDSSTAAYQVTVQESNWQNKAIRDARKALKQLNATRYFFITSRAHWSTELRELENNIYNELKIPATCLGAKEIAAFLIERDLVAEFLDAIGAPLPSGVSARPDKHEIFLHTYVVISKDRHHLQNSVYDDTLLIVCYSEGNVSRNDLAEFAIHLLQCDSSRYDVLSTRIDSLLTRGRLISMPNKNLTLSPKVKRELENAERVYFKEFEALSSAQTELMAKEFDVSWTCENAHQASSLLARAFIQKQLEAAEAAQASFTALGLTKHIGNPVQEIRDYLVAHRVPPTQIDTALSELIDQAKDLPIIHKLTRAAVFVALEGTDPISGAKALGASRWSDVKVMLDTSVAIPYLCGSLYRPTADRFSYSNYQTIVSLQELGARTLIPYFYIKECASHLLLALNYENFDRFSDALPYSRNGYVSHYYHLKQAGVRIPESIRSYLATFAPSCIQSHWKPSQWIRKLMTEIQPLFLDYKVYVEDVPKIPSCYRDDIEREYSFQLRNSGRTKPAVLIDDDVKAMGHIKRQIIEKIEHWILLTWDRSMILLSKRITGCGWVISPDVAADFAQPYRPLSEAQLCLLAHSIARSQEKPLVVWARILDRVVRFASDRMQDWEFQKKIDEFRIDLLDRIDFNRKNYEDWADLETDKFLQQAGVEIETVNSEAGEI